MRTDRVPAAPATGGGRTIQPPDRVLPGAARSAAVSGSPRVRSFEPRSIAPPAARGTDAPWTTGTRTAPSVDSRDAGRRPDAPGARPDTGVAGRGAAPDGSRTGSVPLRPAGEGANLRRDLAPGLHPRGEQAPDPIVSRTIPDGPRLSVPSGPPSGEPRPAIATPPPASGEAGALALGYASSGHPHGHGSASSFFFSTGYYNLAPYGANPYFFHYAPVPYWYWGYRPWGYCAPYSYLPPWYACGAPGYSGSYFQWNFFSRRWRFSLGFGYSYSPYTYASYYEPFYPCYRRYVYYPYTYYSTVVYYPAYSAVYHSSAPVSYVETGDPYVDYVDYVDAAPADAVPEPAAAEPVLRSEFLSPLVPDFPEDLHGTEAIARGEEWMKEGRFLLAAESFRRAFVSMPGNAYPALRMGEALFATQEHTPLATLAIETALSLDSTLIARHRDIRDGFPGPVSFDTSKRFLERTVMRSPKDGESRFLLAYVLFASGDFYAARQEFSILEEGGFESPHLGALSGEAERRLLAR